MNLDQVKLGHVLYNTIYTDSTVQKIESLDREPYDIILYLIGGLTYAKGIDQVIDFLGEFFRHNVNGLKIKYLVVGNGPLSGIIDLNLHLLAIKYEWFSYQIFYNLKYEQINYIHNISDIYIMLHRISIFDFPTLEAMKNGKCIILSPVGGKLEFDVDNNIIFYRFNANKIWKTIMLDSKSLGEKNKQVCI